MFTVRWLCGAVVFSVRWLCGLLCLLSADCAGLLCLLSADCAGLLCLLSADCVTVTRGLTLYTISLDTRLSVIEQKYTFANYTVKVQGLSLYRLHKQPLFVWNSLSGYCQVSSKSPAMAFYDVQSFFCGDSQGNTQILCVWGRAIAVDLSSPGSIHWVSFVPNKQQLFVQIEFTFHYGPVWLRHSRSTNCYLAGAYHWLLASNLRWLTSYSLHPANNLFQKCLM